MKRPLIGVTMGDRQGSGRRSSSRRSRMTPSRCLPALVIGNRGVLEQARRISVSTERSGLSQARRRYVRTGTLDLLDLHNVDLGSLQMGRCRDGRPGRLRLPGESRRLASRKGGRRDHRAHQ